MVPTWYYTTGMFYEIPTVKWWDSDYIYVLV
jgi:hypothetical protein